MKIDATAEWDKETEAGGDATKGAPGRGGVDAGIDSIGEVLNIDVELRVSPSTEED